MNHRVTLRCNRRSVGFDLRHVLAALQWPKILVHQLARLLRIEVPNNRQARVVRGVIELEKIPHVLQLRGLNIEVRTDDFAVVRMLFRKELMEQPFFHHAVGSVLHALPALIADHVLLIRKIGLVQFVRQITHAVGLQPQRELQLIRRQRFEIVGAVKIGRAVDIRRPRRFQVVEMRTPRHVPRSFEHHVLE